MAAESFLSRIPTMISSQSSQARAPSLGEVFVETVILALKGLIPMVWLRSKTSPVQFLVGGTALLLLALAISHFQTEPNSTAHPDNGKRKGILLKSPKPRHAYKPRVAFDTALETGNKALKRSHGVCADGGVM
ncbi:hypothetical protein B0T21DRAFT_298117 [Apiosordaria backusii]|uniref:Uncharacterized protein n=1 Tax=Apiosordaria backusii TaxID=314023 RepID=A0AA40A716_9PEZI|nr:hypothetical protein B0T21DRAFT_298117 [Apiosordaria backusii]